MVTRTAEEWAGYIKAAIEAAEADGCYVQIDNWCCGCSRSALVIGTEGLDADMDEVTIWGALH